MKTKSLKKIVSFIVAVSLVVTLFSVIPITVTASAETTSGATGDCTWTLDGTHLTISGNGYMDNYASITGSIPGDHHSIDRGSELPWGNDITSVTVEQGVTRIGENAFRGCTGLTSITIPDSVTRIGSSAFEGCAGLTSVTISDSVTYIGSFAFEGCAGLTSVTISDSVTYIGSSAIGGCTSLTTITVNQNNKYYSSVDGVLYNKDKSELVCYPAGKTGEYTIPGGVTSIGSSAFDGCESLTSITIPDSVTSIGWYAFEGCTGLTSVTIPDSVTEIGGRAFEGCASLTSITIPDSVTSIGWNAFRGCTGLTSITIPDSVTSIGDCTFCGCTSLTNITIPDSVTSIGRHAFYGCKSLTNITISNSVTSIGWDAFRGCTGLTSVTIPDSVTSIGYEAFYNCTGLTNITIGNSVTSIEGWAFYGCTGLTNITIPDSVTSIGEYAFSDCTNLKDVYYTGDLSGWCKIDFCKFDRVLLGGGGPTCNPNLMYYATNLYINGKLLEGEITIPDDIKSIGGGAFYGCTGLTSITIPDSVTSIGREAFEGCTELTSITIPDGVTNIGSCAFYECTGLTSITIPDSVTRIGYGAFYNTAYYNNDAKWTGDVLYIGNHLIDAKQDIVNGGYTIRQGTKCIAAYAFSGCTGLTSITISDSVTSIGECAFYDCTGLTSIIIPDSVTSIGEYAFSGCENLKDVYYTGDLGDWCKIKFDYYNPMCYAANLYINGKLLEGEITIPDDVTSIGGFSFSGCTSLTRITIPDSVTSIGEYAFRGCTGLTSVTIPDSVTSINCSAFQGCTSLTSITIPDSVTEIVWNAFSGCRNLVIKTTENSAAHKYAVKNNIKYELIEPVTVEGEDKNITISTDSSVIPSTGVSLSAEKVEKIGEKYETQLKNLGAEKFTAYNIDLMKGEEKVQPNGKVTVSIAVPDGMDGAKCKVYRAESDGTLTDMKASLNDGKLTFTTDHFSLYVITQSAVKLGDVNGDGQVTIKDAIAILRHNAEVELLTGSQIIAGDLNGDGTVNPKDAILLLQYNAQIIDKFPIE